MHLILILYIKLMLDFHFKSMLTIYIPLLITLNVFLNYLNINVVMNLRI
jgi:hypothetical protein